jgi:hypothetical protein
MIDRPEVRARRVRALGFDHGHRCLATSACRAESTSGRTCQVDHVRPASLAGGKIILTEPLGDFKLVL